MCADRAPALMEVALFGATHGVCFAVACFLVALGSGHHGIHLSQRIAAPKTGTAIRSGATLGQARTGHAPLSAPQPAPERPRA